MWIVVEVAIVLAVATLVVLWLRSTARRPPGPPRADSVDAAGDVATRRRLRRRRLRP